MRSFMQCLDKAYPLALVVIEEASPLTASPLATAAKQLDVELNHGIRFLLQRIGSQDKVHAIVFWEAGFYFSACGVPNKGVPRFPQDTVIRIHGRTSLVRNFDIASSQERVSTLGAAWKAVERKLRRRIN